MNIVDVVSVMVDPLEFHMPHPKNFRVDINEDWQADQRQTTTDVGEELDTIAEHNLGEEADMELNITMKMAEPEEPIANARAEQPMPKV